MLNGDFSRSAIQGWRKEVVVDALMSLAMCTGAIPGLQGHLEAAHKLAVASPAQGGGVEAAMLQLKGLGQQPNTCDSGDSTDHLSPVSPEGEDDNSCCSIVANEENPSTPLASCKSSCNLGLCRSIPATGSTKNTAFCIPVTHPVIQTAH